MDKIMMSIECITCYCDIKNLSSTIYAHHMWLRKHSVHFPGLADGALMNTTDGGLFSWWPKIHL